MYIRLKQLTNRNIDNTDNKRVYLLTNKSRSV